MQKKKPSPNGFIAICECGAVVGALDFNRTDRKDAGNIISEWLMTGHTVKPMYGAYWSVPLEGCRCISDEDAAQEEMAFTA